MQIAKIVLQKTTNFVMCNMLKFNFKDSNLMFARKTFYITFNSSLSITEKSCFIITNIFVILFSD